VREVMDRAKPLVERFLDEHRIPYVKSDCNFMLVQDGDPTAVFEYLKERGILVRPQRQAPQYFRVSVGTVAEMQRFLSVYAGYLDRTRAAGKDAPSPAGRPPGPARARSTA
jgi:histidinol-phosphate/aromatic aminotransferase/cobyric acid decarboxylase-like protein